MLDSLRGRLILLTSIALLTTGGLALILISSAIENSFIAYVTEQEDARNIRIEGLQSILPEMLSAYYEKYPERANWETITQELNWLVPDGLLLPKTDGNYTESVRLYAQSPNDRCETLLPVIHNGKLVSQVCFDSVSTALNLVTETPFHDSVQRSLFIALSIAGVIALLLTTLLAHHLLQPLDALTNAARTIGRGATPTPLQTSSITEIRELTTAFNTMAEALETTEALRRNMVSDVAHELRTPLTNVYGYLEAINDGVVELTPSLIESLTEEVGLLSRLVDDLQDLALAEAGQLPLHNEFIEMNGLIAATLKLIQLAVDNKSIELSVNPSASLPLVQADQHRIIQVLRNLIGNAVTNTPEGGRITVETSKQDVEIEVRISNTGEPISAEHLPFVFERFYRPDHARARSTGGHGLGLAIVKQLIEAHGGRVGVESTRASGTSFFFTLPLAAEV